MISQYLNQLKKIYKQYGLFYVIKKALIEGKLFFAKHLLSLYFFYVNYKFLNSTLEEIKFSNNDVIIYAHTFFDRLDQSIIWNGGAEKYYIDLAENISKNLNKKVLLIQLRCNNNIYQKINNLHLLTIKNLSPFFIKFLIRFLFTKENISISDYLFLPPFLKRHITLSHGIAWDETGLLKNIHKKDILSSLKKSNHIASVDTTTISFAAGLFGKEYYKKIQYIPNYVDLEEFSSINKVKNEKITILYPRRFSFERGFFEMILIAKKVLEKYDVNFIFCGSGDKLAKEKLNDLIKLFPNNITQMELPSKKMKEIYQKVDITVIPTQYAEGTSLSCIEAMASGNAILSTIVGGLGNLIIHQYNGILSSTDQDKILGNLIVLIENENLRNEISKNAIKVAKAFDKKIWDRKWINLIKSL